MNYRPAHESRHSRDLIHFLPLLVSGAMFAYTVALHRDLGPEFIEFMGLLLIGTALLGHVLLVWMRFVISPLLALAALAFGAGFMAWAVLGFIPFVGAPRMLLGSGAAALVCLGAVAWGRLHIELHTLRRRGQIPRTPETGGSG